MLGHRLRRWPNIYPALGKRFVFAGNCFSPMAETGFSHKLTAYKIVGYYFWLSYRKISLNNQVENIFLESVTFLFHARMLSSEVAQSLKSYRSFRTLGSGSLSVTAMLDISGKANTSIHGLGEDDTARKVLLIQFNSFGAKLAIFVFSSRRHRRWAKGAMDSTSVFFCLSFCL